jgi:D-galactarolactone isomerase
LPPLLLIPAFSSTHPMTIIESSKLSTHAAKPDSSGAPRPHTSAPPLACDAHIHVFDGRFEHGAQLLADATANDYRKVQALFGTERTVVVQPRASGIDNSATLDAIAQLGIDRTRGVAVVRPDVTDAELHRLHEGGIRGIRFTLFRPPAAVHHLVPQQPVVSFDMVETLAHRVHAFGWHVQLHWEAQQIVSHRDLLLRLPTPMVFDHLARLTPPGGIAHPAFDIVRALLEEGRGWLKLSGPYLDSRVGAAADYDDMHAVARAWVKAAPDRPPATRRPTTPCCLICYRDGPATRVSGSVSWWITLLHFMAFHRVESERRVFRHLRIALHGRQNIVQSGGCLEQT